MVGSIGNADVQPGSDTRFTDAVEVKPRPSLKPAGATGQAGAGVMANGGVVAEDHLPPVDSLFRKSGPAYAGSRNNTFQRLNQTDVNDVRKNETILTNWNDADQTIKEAEGPEKPLDNKPNDRPARPRASLGFFEKAVEGGMAVVNGVIDFVAGGINKAIDFVGGVIGDGVKQVFGDKAGETVKKVAERIQQAVSKVAEKVQQAVSQAAEGVKKAWNVFTSWFG